VNGITSSSIPYNADAVTMKAALEALSSVEAVNITKAYGVQKYLEQYYTGHSWNITFTSVLSSQFTGIIDMELDSSSIICSSCKKISQELEIGHGPFVPVEISFNDQQFTSNRKLFELFELFERFECVELIELEPHKARKKTNSSRPGLQTNFSPKPKKFHKVP
jgi:hypothetical protein